MKKQILSLLLLGALTAASQAAVLVTLTGSPTAANTTFLLSGGGVVPDGSLIRIGAFDSLPTNTTNFAVALVGFHEFARTTMGNTTNVNTGHVVKNSIAGSSDLNSPDADSFFVGKRISIIVYSTPTGLEPTAQIGIFNGTASNLYADQLNPASVSTSTLTPAGTFTDGGANPQTTQINGATNKVLAAQIPEPATGSMLLAIAGTLMLVRRRK